MELSRALEEAIRVGHLKGVLLEKELRGNKVGSCRYRALEGALEAEHLKRVLLERELRGDEAGIYRI